MGLNGITEETGSGNGIHNCMKSIGEGASGIGANRRLGAVQIPSCGYVYNLELELE